VDEATARLPAAAAGWLGVLFVMCLAARLYDRRTALAAGIILATSFGFVTYARRATADAETATGLLAAIYLFERYRNGTGQRWVVILWLLMAFTSLTKGLLGFALPVVAMGYFGTWKAWLNRSRSTLAGEFVLANRWFFNRWTFVAVPLAVATYLAPFLVSQWQSGAGDGLAMVFRENVQRFVAPRNHTGPVYLYLGVVFVLAAPWSAFLPAAVFPGRTTTDGYRLARAYFWAVFLFFTASASRRSYYLLPVLPAVSLLIGRALTAPVESLRPLACRLRFAGFVCVGLGTPAAGAFLLPFDRLLPTPYNQLPPLPARWAFALGWVVGASGFATAVIRKKGLIPATALVATLGLAYTFLVAMPAADEFRTRKAFSNEVRERTSNEPDRLALFHARDVAFDLGRTAPVPDYATQDALIKAIRAGTVRWVIARTRYLAGIDLPATILFREAVHPWEGIDQLGDKMVLMEVAPLGGN
jgi:4-amino-4-deoxy-L-arabinose transferase-like glycosyltransferase